MAKDLHYYASRGMLGHSALLDPEAFVAQAPPEMQAIGQMGPPGGELVAKNSVNEFGLADRLKIDLSKNPAPVAEPASGNSPSVRSRARSQRNEELMQQGMSASDILADESKNPMR